MAMAMAKAADSHGDGSAVERVKAALARAEEEERGARAALDAAVDADLAAGAVKTSPALIEARRRLHAAQERVAELQAALPRAQARDAETAALEKEERDRERRSEALGMVPEFLRLAAEVGYTRGANKDVLQQFIRHGLAMLNKHPNPPQGARENLQGDLYSNAEQHPARDDDYLAKPPRNFLERTAQSVGWWFGISTDAVLAMQPDKDSPRK